MMIGPSIYGMVLFQMSFSPHTAVYSYVKIIASLLFIVLTCSGLYMICAIVGWQYGVAYFLFLIAEVTYVQYLSCLSVVYILCVGVCVCMCVYICVSVSVHVCVECICLYKGVYVCVYLHVSVYGCICTCMYVSVCLCMCVSVCLSV